MAHEGVCKRRSCLDDSQLTGAHGTLVCGPAFQILQVRRPLSFHRLPSVCRLSWLRPYVLESDLAKIGQESILWNGIAASWRVLRGGKPAWLDGFTISEFDPAKLLASALVDQARKLCGFPAGGKRAVVAFYAVTLGGGVAYEAITSRGKGDARESRAAVESAEQTD